MAEEKIKAGREIVKEFMEGLSGDSALDKGVVDALASLHKDGKLTQTRLAQELEAKRKELLAHD